MRRDAPRAALVVPLYRSAEAIDALLAAIAGIAERWGGPFEVVFVDDGCPDRSGAQVAAALAATVAAVPFAARVVYLSRNFGAFAAIRAGLEVADADLTAVMAADLQEPAELIDAFFQVLARGEADIAYGVRTARDDPWTSRVAAAVYWWLYRRLAQPSMPAGGVDVFAATRAVIERLLALEARHTSLVGQLVWLGFRQRGIPYARRARTHGRSAWTLRKKIDYLVDSLFAFTDFPIRALTIVGAVGVTASLVAALSVIIARVFGDISVPGYTPIVLAILFFGALNLIGLGVVGAYAFRAFEAAKRRPGAVVARVEVFNPERNGEPR